MSNITTRAKALADRLCAEHGGSAVIVRTTTTEATPWDEGTTTTTETEVGVVETGWVRNTHPETIVSTGDWYGVMAVPASIEPQALDVLRVRGRNYTIAEVKPLAASTAEVAAYAITARA